MRDAPPTFRRTPSRLCVSFLKTGTAMDGRMLTRRWIRSAVIVAVGAGAAAALVFAQVSPLSTHRLVVPLNSGAATAPVALKGLSDLPSLVTGDGERQTWAILGGTLLQIGLSRLSAGALERAIANDQHNRVLHVALGEALTLAEGGLITNRAKAEFEVALNADPNDLVARFYMAYWLLQNGKAKPALVKWVGLMRTVGADRVWYGRLWAAMPSAAEQVGVSEVALQALCVAGM
jgi:hypothetical protein